MLPTRPAWSRLRFKDPPPELDYEFWIGPFALGALPTKEPTGTGAGSLITAADS